MSTEQDMFSERDEVIILSDRGPVSAHYDSLPIGEIYFIPLVSGAFSIYRKTNLFDDELIQRVNTQTEAVRMLSTL